MRYCSNEALAEYYTTISNSYKNEDILLQKYILTWLIFLFYRLFPEYFYSFLQSYMLIFSGQPILPPDEKILRIHQDIKNIIKIFTQPSDTKNYKDLVEETTDIKHVDNINDLVREGFKVLNINIEESEDEEDRRPVKKELGPDNEGLILITSLVTSCIRGLHHCTSKLYCLEILQLLCENSTSETILNRILPYIVSMTLLHCIKL